MGAIAATVTRKWDDGRMIHVIGTLVFSGNYVAAGDPLDFSGLEIPSAAVPVFCQASTAEPAASSSPTYPAPHSAWAR
jgi:hypothetical protein